MGVAAVLDRDHAAGDPIEEHFYRDVGEGDGYELVDGVGFAAAQVVSQIADHDFVAGAAADFVS